MIREFKFFDGFDIHQDVPVDLWEPSEDTLHMSNPRYWDTTDFTFIGLSEIRYSLDYPNGYKIMLFRHIRGGDTIQGNHINQYHPMWYYNSIEI